MEQQYDGVERRKQPVALTEKQIEEIAERAAEVALQRVYASVGKSVVNKVLYLVGAAAIGLTLWLNTHGIPTK